MKSSYQTLFLGCLSLWIGLYHSAIACPPKGSSVQAILTASALQKISFDIAAIDPNGLVGNDAGQRSLMYEFCIPRDETRATEIRRIDPTIQLSRSPGRIGCQPNEYLAIGTTHNAQWREILLAIARLDYVRQINEFFGE